MAEKEIDVFINRRSRQSYTMRPVKIMKGAKYGSGR
jgi:hypothetical protein